MRLGRAGHTHGSNWRQRLALAAAMALACLFAAVPRAHAANAMEVAIQDDPVFVAQTYYDRDKALAQAKRLGVTRIRVNMTWSSIVGRDATRRRPPGRVQYNWVAYDSLIDAAATHGIRIQPALTGPAPAWATGDGKVGPYKPKARYYRAFVRAAAEHFKGRVDRYSIWNEPNYIGWIAPLAGSGKVYRSLYATGYSAIKSVDPDAAVLIAETSPYALKNRARSPLEWLREVTCVDGTYRRPRCGELKADGFAHHPYDFDHPPGYKYPGADNVTVSTLDRLTGALDKLARVRALRSPAGGPLDLYLTEYGYFAGGKRRTPESRRSKYIPQAFTTAQRNPRVRQMLHYLLVQPSARYRFFDTSIVSNRGSESLTFRRLARWAGTAKARGDIYVFEPPPPPSSGGSEDGTSPPTAPPCTISPLGIPCPANPSR